jgi:Leucine-rich repeat (LRR) protein
MIDEDELDEVEEGLVDLAMRGWRTLDEHPLDPRSKRVQLEHNELSTLPKTIGTLEFMWKLDVSHNRLEALPRTIGKCTRLRILNVDHNYLEDIPKVRSRRPVVLGWFHFLGWTRVHQTRSGVVSFSNSRPFGPSRCSAQVPQRPALDVAL